MDAFEAANRRALAEDINDESIRKHAPFLRFLLQTEPNKPPSIMVNHIGSSIAYTALNSRHFCPEAQADGLWIPPPLLVGYEPTHWRPIDSEDNFPIAMALRLNFAGKTHDPPDPDGYLRLHRAIKQAAYRRMFLIDIITDEWPWNNPDYGGWEWWRTKEGKEGRKIIRRKLKFWLWEYGPAWVSAKRHDFRWAFLLVPRVLTLGVRAVYGKVWPPRRWGH